MAKTTMNLGLPLDVVGHVQMQQSFKKAMGILDEAVVSGGEDLPVGYNTTLPISSSVVAPNATDLDSVITLANELKSKINAFTGLSLVYLEEG